MPERLLLVSDLDDTLLGDDDALLRFSEFVATSEVEIVLAYASGRFCDTIWRDVETTALPEPVAVIGGVGSEIRSYPDGELNRRWIEQVAANWSAETVREALADEDRLELQEESSQSDYKVSYYLYDAPEEEREQLLRKLREAGVEASMIYSSRRDLDFLPLGADKGKAAAFLAGELGYGNGRVAVAGNSGNDAKLFEHGFRGIIVANAHDDLKQLASQPRTYLSRYPLADGVREGLAYWIQQMANDE